MEPSPEASWRRERKSLNLKVNQSLNSDVLEADGLSITTNPERDCPGEQVWVRTCYAACGAGILGQTEPAAPHKIGSR